MTSIHGILWDFDGVIADTGELHYQSWAISLSEEGIPFDRETFHRGFGMVGSEVLPFWLGRPLDPGFVAAVADRKEKLFRDMTRGVVRLLPGVKDWLSRFRAMNAAQAIASSAPAQNLEVLIDALGIRGSFAAVVSADGMSGKPDPAVFLEAARRIGVQPDRCLVIEDSPHGITAARRGGMRCVGVTNTHPAHILQDADIVLDSLESLTEEMLA